MTLPTFRPSLVSLLKGRSGLDEAWFRRLLSEIEARIAPLEGDRAAMNEVVEQLRQVGLKRLTDVLNPAILAAQQLNEQTSIQLAQIIEDAVAALQALQDAQLVTSVNGQTGDVTINTAWALRSTLAVSGSPLALVFDNLDTDDLRLQPCLTLNTATSSTNIRLEAKITGGGWVSWNTLGVGRMVYEEASKRGLLTISGLRSGVLTAVGQSGDVGASYEMGGTVTAVRLVAANGAAFLSGWVKEYWK